MYETLANSHFQIILKGELQLADWLANQVVQLIQLDYQLRKLDEER
jgi:hypothetical protein